MTRPLGKRVAAQLRKIARLAPIVSLFSAMRPSKARVGGPICTIRRRNYAGQWVTETWPGPDYGTKRDDRGKVIP